MNQLLHLNEFTKRLDSTQEIEQVAKLTEYALKKIFDATFFGFFLKENNIIKPIYTNFDAQIIFDCKKLYKISNESFIVHVDNIDSKDYLHKILKFNKLNYFIAQSFVCENGFDIILNFGVKDLFKDSLEYMESFLNVIKLKLKYLFSINNLKKSLENAKSILNSSLNLLSNLAEIRDVYTKGHMQRVAFYAKKIAINLKLENIDIIERAALLHDIGKIGIPDAILLKPSKLSEQEYNFIKKHPEFSEFILSQVKDFEDIVKIIRSHHEFLDGSGYPDGLKNGQIMLEAKIITIADIFDALTTDRPYRKAMKPDEAIEFMFDNFKGKIDEGILRNSIGVLLEAKNMICDDQDYNKQFEEMRNMVFFIDYETGFYSKYYLPKFSHRLDKKVQFLLLDLQDMRTINFTYSRIIGDQLIYKFSQFIREVFAKYNSEFFRVGGDSFIVVLKEKPSNLINDILDLDSKLKASFISINPSFWYACCDYKDTDNINICLQELTNKIFYKRRIS
ncbi:MAG: bifunctional diguanylate cyclase/phosphohydrolase [Desulfurella sp.]|uniref:bifunctional diguanylate cyclase/phosphohydrolase n=1 Tax=Desulfurella sp. TaxID=1962857 RepID=UPI003D0F900F